MKSSSKVLTPEQKYMQTATGAMAKPPNPEDLKFKTAVDGYVHLHPGSVTAKVVRFVPLPISQINIPFSQNHSKNEDCLLCIY